jgi:hypothetical protein
MTDSAPTWERPISCPCRASWRTLSEDGDLVAKAEENNEQNFRFAFDKKFEPAVLDR